MNREYKLDDQERTTIFDLKLIDAFQLDLSPFDFGKDEFLFSFEYVLLFLKKKKRKNGQ